MVSKNKPTKLYYTISEVSDRFGVNQSLIRYWEKIFPQIKPRKSSNGVRRFTPNDLIVIEKIYSLLKVEGYTIEGAKLQLAKKQNHASSTNYPTSINEVKHLRDKLQSLKNDLLELKESLSISTTI